MSLSCCGEVQWGERWVLPGPERSLSFLGPYLKRGIYGGAALGRGFEELSGGERGQTSTLQVPSVGSCGSVFLLPRHMSFHSGISVSRAHITRETNKTSPETPEATG